VVAARAGAAANPAATVWGVATRAATAKRAGWAATAAMAGWAAKVVWEVKAATVAMALWAAAVVVAEGGETVPATA